MPYTPILATLGYVFSPDGRRVLMIHRNARPDDAHFGKYNGLGGKLDAGEDVVAGCKREIREEAGIECDAIRLAGTISWPGFGKRGEDWFGFIFRVECVHRHAAAREPEGHAGMGGGRPRAGAAAVGGRPVLPAAGVRPAAPQFHGVMPYRDGRPVSWSYTSLGAGKRICGSQTSI